MRTSPAIIMGALLNASCVLPHYSLVDQLDGGGSGGAAGAASNGDAGADRTVAGGAGGATGTGAGGDPLGDTGGVGGVSATGGRADTGGTAGTGGSMGGGTGGTSATGGVIASGGLVGAGGTGGAGASGTASGTDGGSGGGGGALCPPEPPEPPGTVVGSWFFLDDSQGAEVSGPSASLLFDGSVGCPDPGALRASVTFTASDQQAQVAIGALPDLDLRGTILSARVEVISGSPGGTRMFIKSGPNDIYADADPVYPHVGGGWTRLVMNPDAPVYMGPGFSAMGVRELGVMVDAPTQLPSTVVLLIDTIVYARQ
jgi:hypothetical protein